jgi:regulatory protein
MPIVTALERQKRNKERVNVYLDGEFAFGLPEIEAVQLRKGQELTAEQITLLREKDAVHQAVERGIRLLSFRPRSTQEIRENLTRHDTPEPVLEAALEQLQKLGYLDDEAFARFWIENRTQFKPRGATALRYELLQKGISREVADPIIDQVVDEFDSALRAAQKKLVRYRGKPQAEYKRKMSAFLQRQGFGFDTIRQVINHLMQVALDDDPDFFATSEDEGTSW